MEITGFLAGVAVLAAGGAQAQASASGAVAEPQPVAADIAPARCASDQHWDPGMAMCMAGKASPAAAFAFQLNQFVVTSSTSGPRGQSRVTGPGMWMLTYERDVWPGNHFSVDVMGSPEQLTVGDRGTPQLLQTENVDNMHAHDTIMALEFRDTLAVGRSGARSLTFLFAPRGAAAAGPVPFMHRESAEGNPDAPLGHALQDGFHDVSTVFGVALRAARTTLEVTGFSGHDVTWPLPLHSPDSFGVRLSQDIDGHVGVGGSYADALLPDAAGGAQHSQFISAWLTTSHRLRDASLRSASIWGQVRDGSGVRRNSFLEEAVYQAGKNKLFGRAELLQLAPDQLAFTPVGGAAAPEWVAALTAGYERTVFERHGAALFAGGSYTQDWVPAGFRPAYGSDPHGLKVYLRIAYTAGGGDVRP